MGADGIWNPADYITTRYEIDNPYYQGKSIHGNRARANFNKIPQEAVDYISGEVQKRLDSGYRLNKWFLRMLEDKVKANWPNDVPSNWDISSAVETDSSMARHINKQNKRVGNTQAQVAEANPGDTVLAGGKSVELSQKDIDKAQQNTGISNENAEVISKASDAFNRRHEAEKQEKQESLDKASQMTEHEQALRENAQKALDDKNAEKDKNWQDQQKQNAEKNAEAEQTARVQHTSVQQSLQNKSVQDANEEKMQALYGNNGKPSIKGTVDTSGNTGANDQAAINARMKQAQETAKQTYDQTVSDIASNGDAMSMSQDSNNNEVSDESLVPVENIMPQNGINGFIKRGNLNSLENPRYYDAIANLQKQITNRDNAKSQADWVRFNKNAKDEVARLVKLCEPWE